MIDWLIAIVRRFTAGGQRVRTPSVLQLEAAECGAAALAMILGYHGRRVPLEELRLVCGVSRDGSKASNLLKAARHYGLTAKGLKAEPEHIGELTLPLIAFVNFCHFIVVEGIGDTRVDLNDPANGRYSVTRQEFDDMFTGVALVFEPGPGFERRDTRPSVAASLIARMTGFRSAISFVVLVSLALVLPGLALPAFTRAFIDYVVVRDLDDWLAVIIAGMLATAIVRFLLKELEGWHLTRAETRLAIQSARDLFQHILRLPIPFFGARYAGEIASRLQLNDGLANLLTGRLAEAVLSLVSALFFFSIMCLYSVPLSLVILALSALNLLLLFSVSKQASEGYRKLSIQQGKLAGVALSGLQDVETYKAAGSESLFLSRLTGLHAAAVSTQQATNGRLVILNVAPALVSALITAAILVLGGREVMAGNMSLGSLVAFQTLAVSFIAPLTALMGLAASLQEVRSFTERIDDVLMQPVDKRTSSPSGDTALARLPRGAIALQNVAFGYLPLEAPLIGGLDLEARPGAQIALVGPSGSGKSTVGRLLAGVISPTAGRVLLDDAPLLEWPGPILSDALAYVDQTTVLFEGTIRENLTLWEATIPDADIIAAAQDAMIHEVISERPGGYDALVEENGRNFSGGQRQRLEIARALVTNPHVVVLDEATSALDTITEAEIMANLKRRGCTLVVIAHRLSTIRDSDEIIVLDRGQVVERGTHSELIQRHGTYAALIEA